MWNTISHFESPIWLSQSQIWATALTGSQPCLLDVNHYLMLINKSLVSLRLIPNEVGSQCPTLYISRIQSKKFRIWSWSADPLCIARNIVKKFFASKKFFWKWDNLERGLSKILWKFNFIFYGICYQKQKGPRTNFQSIMTLK